MQSLETKSSRPRPKSFETETEMRDETWDLRDRDSKKRVSRCVWRLMPSLETPSLQFTSGWICPWAPLEKSWIRLCWWDANTESMHQQLVRLVSTIQELWKI